ncbi:hypothetical protein ACQ4PT_013106 [Festuca glaucescens]
MARGLRAMAREALDLHTDGQNEESLACAIVLARANPDSALALNLAGTLHVHASSMAWNDRAPGDDEAAAALELSHHRAALEAFSAAARIAPNCVMTGVFHAEALAANQRFADAMLELFRVLSTTANHADPAVNHVGYDVTGGNTAKSRKIDALHKARDIMQDLTAMINNDVVPIKAARLLREDATVDQVRGGVKLLAETYPYSVRAQLLHVHMELEQVRALDQGFRRKGLLRGVLALISDAAGKFNSSHLIALFHAKVLFALGDFDGAERECRRALRIEEPTDPSFDDIPPAVSVPGADYESRVSYVKKQLRILLKRIIVVAAVCWSSIKTTQHGERVDRVISVRVDKLQEHYDGIDQSAAKTISDVVRFLQNQSSWSFFVCPNTSCHGKKFLDTESLWVHMRKKHRDVLWDKLQSVLGSDLYENTSKDDDHPFDAITLRRDSDQHHIFHLPMVQPMFESLLLSPSVGIQAEPLAEMRQRKCREGAEIIADIKKKLRMLPKDELSTQHEELCFTIHDLWLKFLKTSALDHREVILPLARSFQWIQMKNLIDLSAKDLGRFIGGADIDIMSGKVPAAPDRNVSVVHGSKPSHASNIDKQSGENLQTENLQPLCSDKTLKDGEKCEESLVHDIGTSSQSVKEMASTSSCQQSLNVFNKINADKDLSILSLVIRSLCNLRHFRDNFLTEPLVWMPSADNVCIAQQFYEIFTSWEKNDYHLTDVVLTYMKTLLCGVDCTIFSEKVGSSFASEIVATILIGLHMSETCSRFSLNKETEKRVVKPFTCGDCICPTHNLFGIKFNVQMSCECGKCSGEYPCTALLHKLDAGSPQTTKIKSFAELPVLLDEQFCKDNKCKDCGIMLNIDLLLSNTPHFFTIVLNWLGGSESQDTFSEVLAGITSPVDTGFFCKSADSSTMYTVTSMICCADESYVCFAHDNEDKWLIYDFETVETVDTWEHLLERFKDCKLQPQVLFFEVIK